MCFAPHSNLGPNRLFGGYAVFRFIRPVAFTTWILLPMLSASFPRILPTVMFLSLGFKILKTTSLISDARASWHPSWSCQLPPRNRPLWPRWHSATWPQFGLLANNAGILLHFLPLSWLLCFSSIFKLTFLPSHPSKQKQKIKNNSPLLYYSNALLLLSKVPDLHMVSLIYGT